MIYSRCCGGGGGSGTPLVGASVVALFAATAGCTAPAAGVRLLGTDLQAYDPSGVVAAGSRKRLKTLAVTADGALSSANSDVFVVTGGTAFTLSTPGACNPTDVWVKNTTTSALTITPSSGTVDGAATFSIPAASGAGQPAAHFVHDGTNWQVI